jgi:hypothetical protein
MSHLCTSGFPGVHELRASGNVHCSSCPFAGSSEFRGQRLLLLFCGLDPMGGCLSFLAFLCPCLTPRCSSHALQLWTFQAKLPAPGELRLECLGAPWWLDTSAIHQSSGRAKQAGRLLFLQRSNWQHSGKEAAQGGGAASWPLR